MYTDILNNFTTVVARTANNNKLSKILYCNTYYNIIGKQPVPIICISVKQTVKRF